jgi:ABC-type cobalamin/Fe3+-siderophores transport system ATPase subunit
MTKQCSSNFIFYYRYDELQGLTQKNIQALKKSYHVLSIIGSQSSGKSTLLNSLFRTTFE